MYYMGNRGNLLHVSTAIKYRKEVKVSKGPAKETEIASGIVLFFFSFIYHFG